MRSGELVKRYRSGHGSVQRLDAGHLGDARDECEILSWDLGKPSPFLSDEQRRSVWQCD
jgi:hypothetical protein